jgi:predicted phage terminase large subunit-like protein
VLSYSEDLARLIADNVRDILAADWFQQAFPTRIRDGRNRSMDFATTAGGRVFASHMQGGITGHGADLIIIDDPADIKDAEAPYRLCENNDRFDAIIRNRLNHQKVGRIVIVAHRIHPDDLVGRLLAEGGWRHLKLPLVAEHDASYAVARGKWVRRKGELLREGEFTEGELDTMRRRTTVPDFATLYQQAPPERSWNIASEDFPDFNALPAGLGGVVLSIDTAHVPGARNSFSVVQAWRSVNADRFLIDQWRDQVAPAHLETAIRHLINRHRPGAVLIESAGAGISLAASLARRAQRDGFIVEEILTGNRSKLSRFTDVVPILKARSVHLPERAAWKVGFVEELLAFPDGATDDQVDATAQFLQWQACHPPVRIAPPRVFAVAMNRDGRIVAAETAAPRRGYFFARD